MWYFDAKEREAENHRVAEVGEAPVQISPSSCEKLHDLAVSIAAGKVKSGLPRHTCGSDDGDRHSSDARTVRAWPETQTG